MDEGLILWYSNIHDEYLNNDENVSFIISQLLAAEQTKIRSFKFQEDQKRALLSILLQHGLIHEKFLFRNKHDYTIQRTVENKPFVLSKHKTIGFWNYNVSHHGDFVCIASDCKYLVGVDIVDVQTRSNLPLTIKQYVEMFTEQLTINEIEMILQESGDEDARYNLFYLIWSLKEAFIKAIGQGLGYDLLNVEFSIFPAADHNNTDSSSLSATSTSNPVESSAIIPVTKRKIDKGVAVARINGILRSDWRFDYFTLDTRHLVSIARGPLAAALPTFQQIAWDQVLPVIDPFQHVLKELPNKENNKTEGDYISSFEAIRTRLMPVEALCEYADLEGIDVPKSKCCQCAV